MKVIPGSSNDPLVMEAMKTLTPYLGSGQYQRDKENNYFGQNDEFLQFTGGGNSFADERTDNEFFQFSLQNTEASVQSTYLTPGLLFAPGGTPPAGTLRDGTYASIEGTAGAFVAAATNSSFTIQMLHAWIYANPTRIVRMVITSTSSSQADLNAEVINENPFRQLGSRTFRPGKGIDSTSFNDKRITYEFALQADNQTKIKLSLAASSTATITLEIGAIMNNAAALNRKAVAAHRNVYQAVDNLRRKQLGI